MDIEALDLTWQSPIAGSNAAVDIEEGPLLTIEDSISDQKRAHKAIHWLSAHPRLWLITCTIIPLALALVGLTYHVEVDLGLSSFQARDHITYRTLESYVAAVKLHRNLLLTLANTPMSSASPARDWLSSGRTARAVMSLPVRSERAWTFHLIFSLNDTQSTQVNATIFTPEHIMYMHHVIKHVLSLPEYTEFCWLERGGDRCHAPGSIVSEFMNGDELRADWSNRLQSLHKRGVYWFTDDQFPDTGRSSLVRVEFYFGGPFPGYDTHRDRSDEQAQRVLAALVPLRNDLRHVTANQSALAVHWGGDAITGYEIRETVFNDALFALGSLLLVSVLVLVQLRSPFLALYAMYELLIAFPAVYGVYMYACQLESVNLLTGVALFLVIGIGVDDEFVFYYAYQRAHARHPHAPALCLAETYRSATLATFVTSLTTAAAFMANIFSAIPALRMFGIYMSLIVLMNWLLSVTLFPAALITWDRHIRAKERALLTCVIPRCRNQRPNKEGTRTHRFAARLASHVHKVRYVYLVLFAVLAACSIYQGLSLQGAATPPQVFKRGTNLHWFSEWQRSGWLVDGTYSAPPPASSNVTHVTPAPLQVPHTVTPAVLTPHVKTPVTAPSTAPIRAPVSAPVPVSKSKIAVSVVWGLTGRVNGSHVNPRDPFSEWIGIPELDPAFDPLTAPCLDHLATVCDELQASGLLAGPGRCLLREFRQQMTARGAWPSSDRTQLLYHLLLFVRAHIVEYQSDFSLNHFNWTDIRARVLLHEPLDVRVTWLRYSFSASTSRNVSSREAVALYQQWQALLDRLNGQAPAQCRGALQFSETWIEALTETTLVDNISASLVTSLVVALGTLLLFVGNIVIALLALVTLIVNLFLTLGAFKVLGWTLGAVEALSMTLLVGLSVDYVLHLAHAYTVAARRTPHQSRQVLLAEAMQSMGIAIVSGAVTTVASTSMLLLCQIVIFVKFGLIICVTLVSALVLTALLFPTLVLVFAPRHGHTCDVHVVGRTLTRCGRTVLAQNDFALLRERGQGDECHVLVDHVDETD